MQPRLDYQKAAPNAIKAVSAIETYLAECGLEKSLIELVKLRASQINGCSFCIDMHTKDARAKGETEQRLYGLTAWEETPFYNDRERAALKWTQTLTLISENRVPDEIYEKVQPHFTEEELVNLTLVIGTINLWNRFAITFRQTPGTYRPSLAR